MNTKNSRFPLSLSSVVVRTDDQVKTERAVATPQTAMRNSVKDLLRKSTTGAYIPNFAKTIVEGSAGNISGQGGLLISDSVRRAMVARLAHKGIRDEVVLNAMGVVPRHLFVESGLASQAYGDSSLPIGHKQTISQPYIVAYMIEVLRKFGPLKRVLEIGTGCGYQAAVLSLVADEVYSIERIKALHELAKSNLRELRIPNLRLHYGDGMVGLPQAMPFDGIILAAAGMEIPDALLKQLAIGGRLIAPVGARNQVLQLVQRESEHHWTKATLERCHFVPLHEGVL